MLDVLENYWVYSLVGAILCYIIAVVVSLGGVDDGGDLNKPKLVTGQVFNLFGTLWFILAIVGVVVALIDRAKGH